MVMRSLGSGRVSLAEAQNDLPSLGISEKSISESRRARRRLKSVAPLERVREVVCVVLPFIAMCPPGGNNATAFAADYVDHHDLNVFQKTDRHYAVFPATAVRFLEAWAVKNPQRILKVDMVLGEVGLTLALVPLEKHLRPHARQNKEYQSMH